MYIQRVGQYRNGMFPYCNIHWCCNDRATQDIVRRAGNSRYNYKTIEYKYIYYALYMYLLLYCTYSLHVLSLSTLKYPVFFRFVQ